jgi:hypothetical protein
MHQDEASGATWASWARPFQKAHLGFVLLLLLFTIGSSIAIVARFGLLSLRGNTEFEAGESQFWRWWRFSAGVLAGGG